MSNVIGGLTHTGLLAPVRDRVNALRESTLDTCARFSGCLPPGTATQVEWGLAFLKQVHVDMMSEKSKGRLAPVVFDMVEFNKNVVCDFKALEDEVVESIRSVVHLAIEFYRFAIAINVLYNVRHKILFTDCLKIVGDDVQEVRSELGSASQILIDPTYLAELDKIREKCPHSAIDRIKLWAHMFPERLNVIGELIQIEASKNFPALTLEEGEIPQDEEGVGRLSDAENPMQALSFILKRTWVRNFVSKFVLTGLASPDLPEELRPALQALGLQFPPPQLEEDEQESALPGELEISEEELLQSPSSEEQEEPTSPPAKRRKI